MSAATDQDIALAVGLLGCVMYLFSGAWLWIVELLDKP